jgi:hypothetical protein
MVVVEMIMPVATAPHAHSRATRHAHSRVTTGGMSTAKATTTVTGSCD